MHHQPVAPEAAREHRGILVLRRQDESQLLHATEVGGSSQRDTRPDVRVGGVGDHPLAELGHPRDTRVFAAPLLPGFIAGQEGPTVDTPVGNPIGTARHPQRGQAAAILDTDEQ